MSIFFVSFFDYRSNLAYIRLYYRCEVSRNADLWDWNVGLLWCLLIVIRFVADKNTEGLWLVRKKWSRHEMPGFFRRQVNKQLSGCKTLHASTWSRPVTKCLMTLRHLLWWVLGFQPFLSAATSKTRLRSTPRIISSYSKSSKWTKNVSKKLG